MMNWKGFGSDFGIIKVLSWHLLGGSEKMHEVFQVRILNVLTEIQTRHFLSEV
jgi:hypothetical protein